MDLWNIFHTNRDQFFIRFDLLLGTQILLHIFMRLNETDFMRRFLRLHLICYIFLLRTSHYTYTSYHY